MCYVTCVVVNDTLDEMLDESGDEEEQDAIVTQVLDEIGIDISGKVTYYHNILSLYCCGSCIRYHWLQSTYAHT